MIRGKPFGLPAITPAFQDGPQLARVVIAVIHHRGYNRKAELMHERPEGGRHAIDLAHAGDRVGIRHGSISPAPDFCVEFIWNDTIKNATNFRNDSFGLCPAFDFDAHDLILVGMKYRRGVPQYICRTFAQIDTHCLPAATSVKNALISCMIASTRSTSRAVAYVGSSSSSMSE